MGTLFLFIALATHSGLGDRSDEILKERQAQVHAHAFEQYKCLYSAILKATNKPHLDEASPSALARFHVDYALRPESHLISIYQVGTQTWGDVFVLHQLWGYADSSKNTANESNGVRCELFGYVAYEATSVELPAVDWHRLAKRLDELSLSQLPTGYYDSGATDGTTLTVELRRAGGGLSVFSNPDLHEEPSVAVAANVFELLDDILKRRSGPPPN